MVELDAPGFQRAAAVAGIIAAVIWIVPTFVGFGEVDATTPLGLVALGMIGMPSVLTVVAFVGVHGKFRSSYGWSGRIALGVFLVGLLMSATGSVLLFEYLDLLLDDVPIEELPAMFWVTLILLTIGIFLDTFGGAAYGIVLWRRDVGPELGAGLLVVRVVTVIGGTALAAGLFGVAEETLDVLFLHVGLGAALVVYGHHMYTTAETGTPADETN